MKPWAKLLGLFVTAGLFWLWWYPGYDYLIKPQTYRIDIAYMVIVVAAAVFHIIAFKEFHIIVKAVRFAEKEGAVRSGSLLNATNQRFRFGARIIESLWVFGLGVLGVIAVAHPSIVLNPNYNKYVLTYFFGSIALTGYLSVRDLHALHVQRKVDLKIAREGRGNGR